MGFLARIFKPKLIAGNGGAVLHAIPGTVPVTNAENRRLMSQRMPGIQARFDLQFTTDENQRHWQLADAMSVDAAANWMVRRTMRMRTRYEYHNNSYFMGITDTVGNYVIGTGPRLQMLTKNKDYNSAVEAKWAEWTEEIDLTTTLKSMRMARIYNGEDFALMRSNPNLDCPVKLDVYEVEADQVSSPLFGMYPAQYPDQFFDGIVLDPWGKPQTYHILRQHPGAFGAFVILGYEFDPWPARYVLHDYKKIRPGQQRGIPEALPAVPLFAQLRRYTLAVLGAAETAADNAFTIESEAGADDAVQPEPMETFDLEARMATVMPAGWKAHQMKAEQPTTTHEMFVNAILREISRTLNFPLMYATLDARMANMSSAYVVTQPFAKSVETDRLQYSRFLNRIFKEFMEEATRIPGFLPNDASEEMPHMWRWPRVGFHADPMKSASAAQTRIESGVSSIPKECALEGDDWEENQEANAKSLGMSLDEYRAALREKMFAIRGSPSPATVLDDPNPDEAPDDPNAAPAGDDE